jgi:hypothetical protein
VSLAGACSFDSGMKVGDAQNSLVRGAGPTCKEFWSDSNTFSVSMISALV